MTPRTAAGGPTPDLSLGGLDEVVERVLAVASDPDRSDGDRREARAWACGLTSATYVLTGKWIWAARTDGAE